MTYLHNKIGYWELSEQLPDSYLVGTTEQDYNSGAYILLTPEQLAFKEANPDASKLEVLRMQLDPIVEPSAEELRQRALRNKLADIDAADKTSEVFYVDGMQMWLDKTTRTSLLANTIPAERKAGKETTTLWYERWGVNGAYGSVNQMPIAITVPLTWLEDRLAELELYAKATYDATQSNKAAVYALATAEEIEEYEIVGYPEPLNFGLYEEE